MYEELKTFLKGKDPLFSQELDLIHQQSDETPHGQPSNENVSNREEVPLKDNNGQLQILDKYKKTSAYKRLLMRQGQAVRRLERIKENFEKKRMQVTMLKVNQKNQQKTGPLALTEKNNNDLAMLQSEGHYGEDGGFINVDGQNSWYNQGIRPMTQHYTSSLRPVLSSQTPLSHQVIMEERSSIASQTTPMEERESKILGYKKQKELQIIEPYIQTSLSYFKKLHSSKNKKKNQAISVKNRTSSSKNCFKDKDSFLDNISQNFSQYYESSMNLSNIASLPRQSPKNANMLPNVNLVTGIQTYKNALLKNRSYQKPFFKPTHSTLKQSQSKQMRVDPDLSQEASKLSSFCTTTTNNMGRPQTTTDGLTRDEHTSYKDLSPMQNNLINQKANINRNAVNQGRSHTQHGQRRRRQIPQPHDFYSQTRSSNRNQPFSHNLLQNRSFNNQEEFNKSHDRSQLAIHNESVIEQEEEQVESKIQSQQITISSKGKNELNKTQTDQANNIEVLKNGGNEAITNANTSKHKNGQRQLQQLNVTAKQMWKKQLLFSGIQTKNSVKRGKDLKTPIQRYNHTKNQIIQNIKSKQYWPEELKPPEQYREFYWTPDMSFCGFATNVKLQKSSKQLI